MNRLIFVLPIAAVAVGCWGDVSTSVDGTVVDEAGNPVASATAAFAEDVDDSLRAEFTTQTDEDGRFLVVLAHGPGVLSDQAVLEVSKEGYATYSERFRTGTRTDRHTIVLKAE